MTISIPAFTPPSMGSTLAFLAVVAFVCAAWLLAVARAYRDDRTRQRNVRLAAVSLALWMLTTAVLAETGVFTVLAERGLLWVYLGGANGVALAVAASRVGGRIARGVPLGALIGAQAFRLPLELVLHAWYEQGSLPVQMTYEGDNWDILTGILSLLAAFVLQREIGSPRVRRSIAWGVNTVGFLLLLRVMNIALRSTPGPLRTYLEGDPILLAFDAPYTWIVPICVASALAGHIITFRRLSANARRT